MTPRFAEALVVMARVPRPGRCKTRLCPPLTPDEAAAVYRAFLVDLGRELRRWPRACDRVVAWVDDGEDDAPPPELVDAVGPGFQWLRQRGRSLTERMDYVFAAVFEAGWGRVVMRNSDSPHLPAAHLDAAFAELDADGTTVVLGPDLDGGYYLAGLGSPQPGLFPATLSTPSVLAETTAAAQARGLAVALLDAFPDVDTADDLGTFWLEFGARADVRDWETFRLLERSEILERLTEHG